MQCNGLLLALLTRDLAVHAGDVLGRWDLVPLSENVHDVAPDEWSSTCYLKGAALASVWTTHPATLPRRATALFNAVTARRDFMRESIE